MDRIKIIAEIGINANGDINIAKRLIDIAAFAGCDYVKFQKRNPDMAVPEAQKNVIRDTPWGEIKYIDYKYKIEFGEEEYCEIDEYCKARNIKWFASVWDTDSVDFFEEYFPHIKIMKIPSALIINMELMERAKNITRKGGKLLMSTGMSNEDEIRHAIEKISPDVIFHTNSAYPSKNEELNLHYIKWLYEKYCRVRGAEVGYSGHEFGLSTTMATVILGVKWIERHITLDRTMWGSDQMASVEPGGLIKLVKGIRDIENALGKYGPREVMGSELKKRVSLRGN